MSEKVGVYICHCGTNIAKIVDVEEVAHWAAEQENVEVARDYINPEVEVLGKSEEAELIRRDLERDMADRILRRLRARLHTT